MKREKNLKLPKGVIKIKMGYNPNSSSIGTVIYSFPLVYIAASAVFALLVAFISVKRRVKK